MADEAGDSPEVTLSFKVKTASDGIHDITIAETATVMDLKTKLAGPEYTKQPADAQRLIYSGRVMKDEEMLKEYKIKDGNTIHMVKKAQSNLAQNPANPAASPAGAPRAAAGVPQNMAAGTSAGNLLAGLTGARFAGHMGLPGVDTFGADGGMGAPPSEEDVASMLDNPNVQQMMNEALQNPQMIDMIIQQTPHLRDNPDARQMLSSPEFRRMMTDPAALRQAARMRNLMGGMGMGGGGGGFPAPGVTDTTPAGAAGTSTGAAGAANPFGNLFGPGVANPFGAFPQGMTPVASPPAPGSAGQATPGAASPGADAAANPFASMFGAGGAGVNPFAMTPEQMQQAMAMFGGGGMFGGPATSPPPPADTRPPEERYANELRQLNDMGFFDFDRNIEALRRSGGSVQGAINSLLGS